MHVGLLVEPEPQRKLNHLAECKLHLFELNIQFQVQYEVGTNLVEINSVICFAICDWFSLSK